MLRTFVENKHYKFAQKASDWKEAVRMSCESLENTGVIDETYKEEIIACVEKHGPYIVIMPNVAIPHSTENAKGVKKTAIGFMKLEEAVSFDENDPEKEAKLFFTLASCDADKHMDNIAKLSEMLMNDDLVKELEKATCAEDLIKIQEKFLD